MLTLHPRFAMYQSMHSVFWGSREGNYRSLNVEYRYRKGISLSNIEFRMSCGRGNFLCRGQRFRGQRFRVDVDIF